MARDTDTESWSPTVQIPSTIAHLVAILATVFRLSYRWYLSRFWWEDAWAILAPICDILCLCSIWMQTPPSNPHTLPRVNLEANWILSINITSVLWFARISILCSIFRIANPTSKLRCILYCIGVVFLAMQAGLLAQKVFICMKNSCRFTTPVAIAQLITDIVSDVLLVTASVLFLRDLKLPRAHRIMLLLAFSASMLITVVTILRSALLFQEASSTTTIIGHVKGALSLVVCNALVIVTFVYRSYRKSSLGLEFSMIDSGRSNAVELTSVIELPTKFSSLAYPMTSGVYGTANVDHTKPNITTDSGPSQTEKDASPEE